MRALYLALVLAPLLACSGCIGQVETGNGVVIQEFTPALKEVYPGEPITFLLKVKNLGTVEATDVFAELLGLDEDWAGSSQDISDNTIVNGEVLPRETWCQYTQTSSHKALKAPDLTYNTEGESATCTWMYKAPKIPEGFGPTYQITARVFYTYKTEVVKSFTILHSSDLVKYNDQGRPVPSSTVSSTKSPVAISVEARDPIRFWGDSISFPVAITVSNTGGGMACLKGKCKKAVGEEWNKVTLKAGFPGQGLSLGDECSELAGGGKDVEVWPNRDNTIICTVTASGVNDIRGYEQRLMGITAEYSYFTDATSSVKLL